MIRTLQRRGARVLALDITYRAPDGTKVRLRRDCAVQTREAARAEERRVLACIATHGRHYEPSTTTEATAAPATFGEVVKSFLATKATALKPSTRLGYVEILTTRLLPRWRDTEITAIDFAAVGKLDAAMVAEDLSASRRRNVAVTTRSVLRFAVDSGQLSCMPRLPPLPKQRHTILATLGMADVEKILAAASPAARVAIALAAFGGLRAGEVRGLRWGDVDMTGGVLVVRRATTKGETAAPKSGHDREIPIAAPLQAILDTITKREHGALVAVTAHGQAWGEHGLIQVMKRAVVRAGVLGAWRFHDLRHAFVTGLFQRGASATSVQRLAGHSSLVVTQRYAHATRADLRATVDLIGAGNVGATAS